MRDPGMYNHLRLWPITMCLLNTWCASLSESPVASVNGRPRRRCSQACACAACAREVRLAGQPSHGVTVLAPVTRRPPGAGFGTNAPTRGSSVN